MERIPELARYGNGWWPPVRLERFVVFREDCALFAEEAMRITLDDAEVIALDASHIDELLALPERTKTRRVYELRLAQGNLGLAVRHDGRIIAIMWAMLGWLYYGTYRMPLHSDEAYVFDGYVVPAFRGHGLAGYMRHALIKRLADGGRTRIFSVCLADNKPALRFREKLGVRCVGSGWTVRLFDRWRFGSKADPALLRAPLA